MIESSEVSVSLLSQLFRWTMSSRCVVIVCVEKSLQVPCQLLANVFLIDPLLANRLEYIPSQTLQNKIWQNTQGEYESGPT